MAHRRTLIVGFGNPLRGDDALGPVAAELLEAQLHHDEHVQVRIVHQLTPELAEWLAGFDRVVLIDVRAAVTPGEIYIERVQTADLSPNSLSHYVTPGQLLTITETFYNVKIETYIAGITSCSFKTGAALSDSVRMALPDLVERLVTLIKS